MLTEAAGCGEPASLSIASGLLTTGNWQPATVLFPHASASDRSAEPAAASRGADSRRLSRGCQLRGSAVLHLARRGWRERAPADCGWTNYFLYSSPACGQVAGIRCQPRTTGPRAGGPGDFLRFGGSLVPGELTEHRPGWSHPRL